jgi:hypothetical protein
MYNGSGEKRREHTAVLLFYKMALSQGLCQGHLVRRVKLVYCTGQETGPLR